MTKHIRPFVLLAGVLVLTCGWNPAHADDELQAKYEKKIAKEFVSHGGWLVDYDEARAKAKKDNKLIFAYFTRSYSR